MFSATLLHMLPPLKEQLGRPPPTGDGQGMTPLTGPMSAAGGGGMLKVPLRRLETITMGKLIIIF